MRPCRNYSADVLITHMPCFPHKQATPCLASMLNSSSHGSCRVSIGVLQGIVRDFFYAFLPRAFIFASARVRRLDLVRLVHVDGAVVVVVSVCF